MANSTKTTYKPAKKGNYKSVVRMAEGGNVSELDYSERREYIEENYAPFITDAQMIFSIYDSGIEYDYKGDRKQVTQSIIEQYKSLADYTESTLPQETIYEIQDWDLVRKEIDPDTDEVIGETPLEQISSDNTYNFSYNGLVDLNWRVYHDEEYDRFFYVIMPHLGGDIRGNYGDAIILEGNDKEELFYRFYEGFISGGASIYFKFKDGSEIGFDSEQDSDVFYFRLNEVFEPTGMAQKYLNDFNKFDSWYGDEFLEETIDIYLSRNGQAPKMMAGGSLYDETPMAYVQILGENNEGKWINLTDYADGEDVMNGIYAWMDELNKEDGGSREEYEVLDYEGFGKDLYDEYMGENEFDEIIEAYEKYENSDFSADVISAYKNDSGSRNDSLSDVIDEMDNNYFGKYENLEDFGYEMVNQGVYSPSISDVYITDTDKRIIAGEEADSMVDDMSFEDLLNIATDTQSEYEDEKSELEDKISEIESEINDLTDLQSSVDDDDEYESIAEQIEEKEVELDDVQNELDDIDSRFENKAREEAREIYYDEIYDKLENDLDGWLSEMGYDTDSLDDISFISIDYEQIGEELSADYLIIEFDGELYFFNNYKKGGRIKASKLKPKFAYYIVENNTKKLVSGYETKEQATEQRKLLVKKYPSMRFEIFTLGKLESKTDLDVYTKKDYVELSTLDKIKKVSVDAYRYGKDKVGQAQAFLERNDVKGKIKRGARKVADKTKQGASWLQRQWREADFGDGTGRAKFFADGGEIINHIDDRLKREGEVMNPQKKQRLIEIRGKLLHKQRLNEKDTNVLKNEFNYLFSDGGSVSQTDGSIDAQKKGVAKRIKIKNWYTKTYPSDDLGEELNDNITFYDLYVLMYQGNEVYSILGVSDSIVRERVFEKLSETLGVDYEYIYNIWLRSDKYANGGGVDNMKRFDVDFYDSANSNKETYIELTIKQDSLDNAIQDAIKKAEELKKNYIEFYHRGFFLGSINFENSKEFVRGKYYKNYISNTLYEEGGESNALFEIVVVAKGLEKDGGQIIKDRFYINSISVNEAKNIAKKMWEEEMGNSDFHIIDILSDTEYREKYLSKKFSKGGESKGEYDVYDNKRMLLNQANEIEHHSEELNEQVSQTKKVPAWVIAKMERATTDLSDITHYLDGENKMSKGGSIEDVTYEILPHKNKFVVAKTTFKQQGDDIYPSKDFIYGFNDKLLEFDDIKSAQLFIDNIEPKYPYGIPKANAGMYLMASQFLNKQQQQPQVVYYIPQPQPQELENTGIIQNIPEMQSGGYVGYDNELTNDFCITNLIELANELQSVKYYVTNRFKESDFESKNYIGRLTIVFKEPASVNVINSITKFLERAEDCHHIFEQSVNVSGSEPNGLSINLLSDKFSDIEFGKGGKVYDFAPKKINVAKTKKITTQIGDFNLGLISKDFVYFVNMEESDENGNTLMYDKNGELLSDNYFAFNELYETLERESTFDFIHPMMEIQRQEILKGN